MPGVQLVPLATIDSWLIDNVEDWAVLAALAQRGDIEGFVTIDRRMLALSKVLPVLLQTKLTLVVCRDVGNDPLAAAGLVLLHLPSIVRRSVSTSAQLWTLPRPPQRNEENIDHRVTELARHAKLPRAALLAEQQLTAEQLAKPLKDWYVPPSR